MRFLITILFFCSVSYFAFTQTYFNKRYSVSQSSFDGTLTILEDDGYYIVPNAFIDNGSSLKKLAMLKISVNGLLEDTTFFIYENLDLSHTRRNGDLKRFSSTSLYSSGVVREYTSWVKDKASIYKFNNELDTLWTRTYGELTSPDDTNYYFDHFDITMDSGLITAGTIIINGSVSHAMLMKIDSLGNEQWRQYFQSNGPYNIGTNVLALPDGGYVLSAYSWQFQSSISGPYLTRTDSVGNMLWRRQFGHPLRDDGPMVLAFSVLDSTIIGAFNYSDSTVTNNTSFNRLALVKYTLEGEEVFNNKYLEKNSDNQWNFFVSGINIDSNNNIIVVGRTNEPWPQKAGYLFKFANNGDSLWYRQYQNLYGQNSLNYLKSITPTPDGGYAASGYVVPYPPDTGNQDVWVIKVDSMGCIAPEECWVGKKEHIALQKQGALKIYPNPASTQLTIVVPKENESENHLLTIWDMYGRRAEDVEVPSGVTKVSLNLSGFPPGIYTTVSVYKGQVLFRGKFIVR